MPVEQPTQTPEKIGKEQPAKKGAEKGKAQDKKVHQAVPQEEVK